MKNNKEPLVIYWAPATYESSQESWSLLYPEPVSLSSQISSMRNVGREGYNSLYACPAHKDTTKNVFVFKNSVENIVHIPEGFLNSPSNTTLNSRVRTNVFRESSFKGYANIVYNLSWSFAAEDSVIGKFTPSYYPHSLPAEGSLLSIGEFDIGQWFRSFQLDYHIPLSTDKLTFLEGDDLFYLQILTDRPVIFKRFMQTPTTARFYEECGQAAGRYGLFKTLNEKYSMAKKAKIKEQLMHEIKKNLVE